MARRKPTKIGHYRLVREIGRGGMGTVYEAEHERVKSRVAVKVLHPEYSKDPQIVARFRQEPMAANLTRHPGITHVMESDVLPDGTPYLVMEFLDGQSLRHRLRKAKGGLPQLQVVRFARQIADALAAAHAKKIIHRDIKPENIMLVRDDAVPGGERAKVLDFGIAVVAEDASLSISQSNTQIKTSPFASLLGTATYMAPEQCLESGRAVVDDKTDVYGLGILLYESLCGQAPFVAPEMVSVMHKHISEPPTPLSLLRADVHPELEALVLRMLAKSGSERPTMREVSMQLQSLELTDSELSAGMSLPPMQVTQRRSRWWLGLLVPLVLGLVSALYFYGREHSVTVTWRIDSSPPGAEIVDATGQVIGTTPYRSLPKRDVGKVPVTVRLLGYLPESVTLDYERDTQQLVRLRPRSGSAP